MHCICERKNMAAKMANHTPCLISVLGAVGFVLLVYLLPSMKTAPIAESQWNHAKCRFINSSHGLTVNCRNGGLQNVPEDLPGEAKTLDLYGNNITILHNASFKDVPNLVTLIASNNPLSFIDTETMWPLTELRTLILGSCNLQTVSSLLFVKNVLLTKLTLKGNQLNTVPCETLAVLPRLSTMELMRNKIKVLNFDGCSRWHNLKKINLFNNKVEDFHQTDFFPLQNATITFLSLASNKIRNLSKRAFYHLNSVQSLQLQGNHMTSFDIQPFLGMASMKELSIYGCRIHRLLPLGNASYHNDSYPSIYSLNMGFNLIENVPADSYWGFARLQILFLTHNKIRTLGNQSLCQLRSLTELDISINKIASLIPHTFACLPSLTKLNVSKNMIQTLSPQSFNGMLSIKSIFLSHNIIADLNSHKQLWTHGTLDILDISYNNIKFISQGIFHGLSNLKELNLSFNQVHQFSVTAFEDLQNVQRLYLSNQKNIYLEDTFQQLHTVLLLCISNSRIKISQDSIKQFVNMTHLHELRMEKAQLTGSHLYDVVNNQSLFTGLLALKRLRLKDNKLYSLDSRVFYNLSELYHLDMTNSRIQVLKPEVFHPLSSLAKLYLSDNNLMEIAGDTFHGLSHLSFLYLKNNGLRGLEVKTFAQNPKLKFLLLPGNQISIIKPETVFPSNISLHLDVSRNPFTCTCSLTWFRQWLDSADITFEHADQTLCSGTSLKELANKPILSFHPEDHCGVNIILIVVVSFSGVLVGMMAMLAYNKRWWLNHKLFLLKLAIVGYEEMAEDFNAGNYHHHLNLMFQEAEEEWVNQVMKPALEERLPHLQNIIYGDEDLHLGMYYINALYDAIDNSFKTVLLLSNQSVSDAWTMT